MVVVGLGWQETMLMCQPHQFHEPSTNQAPTNAIAMQQQESYVHPTKSK
jgi:hypothetical protein